ncbi:MAG: hypothetical protein RSG79_03620 [Pseudomonas sp.]
MSNQQLDDQMEHRSNAVAAEVLGISVEDVERYVTIDANESDEGVLYGYIASFCESTPLDVRQAAGLGDGFSIDLDPGVFDDEA